MPSLMDRIENNKFYIYPVTFIDKIKRVFLDNPNRLINVRALMDETGVNQQLGNVYLINLNKSGLIKRIYHGHYQLNEER